jgi:hypothetical protein
MKIWLLSQDTNDGYDIFDSCVVAAETEDEARHIHPNLSWGPDYGLSAEWDVRTWVPPSEVKVKYIGVAEHPEELESRVICASFNQAG